MICTQVLYDSPMAHIVYILSGGIACYKSASVIRLLKKAGHTVQPVMTDSATQFITPLTVTALAGEVVRSDLFDMQTEAQMDHIQLSRSGDVILIAPATANFLAKMAIGLCDDLASTVVSASNTPVLVAPSMNPYMWQNPANQHNINTLKQRGIAFIDPQHGDMACGETGIGRMAEPEQIVDTLHAVLGTPSLAPPDNTAFPLAGKRFIMTVGSTAEPIDTVRVLTNTSSGIQGVWIAEHLITQGASVHIVCGGVTVDMPIGASVQTVKTALQMYDTVHALLDTQVFDGAVMVAAVSDYRSDTVLPKKHKKSDGVLHIKLVENPDILQSLSTHKNRPKCVVGFAAETDNVIAYATDKLHNKACDVIFANVVQPHTFGGDSSHAYLIDNRQVTDLGYQSKYTHALSLVQYIVAHTR